MTKERPVAVVTGASRGAGAGIARGLGALGYAVYVTRSHHRRGCSVAARHYWRDLQQLLPLPEDAGLRWPLTIAMTWR